MTYIRVANTEYLAHHGIRGQKWGVRRYQNQDGTLTNAGLARDRKVREKEARKEDRRKKSEAKRVARVQRKEERLEAKKEGEKRRTRNALIVLGTTLAAVAAYKIYKHAKEKNAASDSDVAKVLNDAFDTSRSLKSLPAKQKTGGSDFASKYASTSLKNGRLIRESHANPKEPSNFISQPFYRRTPKQLARESKKYDKRLARESKKYNKRMFRNLKLENSKAIQDTTSQLYKGRLIREVTSNSKEGRNFVSSFINTNLKFEKR